MKIISSFAVLLPALLFVAGCGPAGGEGETHEQGAISVTIWTDKTELFMEYPLLVEGQESEFLAHLTTLSDFRPVTQGKVTLNFKNASGVAHKFVADGPAREGIFLPVAAIPKAGTFDLELLVEGPQVRDLISVGKVIVYAEGDEPHVHEEANLGAISFLKEQQWKIDFRTEEVQRHTLKRTVRAVGEVRPKLQYHADVVSPVEGIILADQNLSVPTPGSEVKKGQLIATISPPLNTEGGWTELLLAYDRAKTEFERAERLRDKKAISEKQYQEAWREYQVRKGSYETFMGDTGSASADVDTGDNNLHLRAPISGIVARVSFVPGQKIEAGQSLFTLINPSKVWISAKVQEKDAPLVSGTAGAYLESIASGDTHLLDSNNSKLLSIGDIVDNETRTIEIIFEVDNPGRSLKVGQFVRVALHTEDSLTDIAVPESAVFDEGGWYAVYVQTEGESFDQRRVKVGARYNDLVQITEGLFVGEHIVTMGGYQVKLASMTTEAGHGHAH